MKKIKCRKIYKIKGNSKYFKNKYGTANPEILIEDLVLNMPGNRSWMYMDGNFAAMLYGMRAGTENLPIDDKVYYGKIRSEDSDLSFGEMVHESELEEI